jgi:hypothetical protein
VIDILVPVLGRPWNVEPFMAALTSATRNPFEVWFLCSPEDGDEIKAVMSTNAQVVVMDFPAGPGDYAKKMNWGFSISHAPWILLGADDITPDPGWDEKALACAGEHGVIGTNDMASAHVMSGASSTHPLVRRDYISERGGSLDGPGVLIHPGYDHNFSERELVELAQARGEWVFCREAVIRHRHPVWGTVEWDDTYRKAMANFDQDSRLFSSRKKRYTRTR